MKRWAFWRQRSLRKTLIFQPIVTFSLVLLAVFLLFNFMIKTFIYTQSRVALQAELSRLDALYVGEAAPPTYASGLINTTYMILDEEFEVQYVSMAIDDDENLEISKKLATYFLDHDDRFDFFDQDDEIEDEAKLLIKSEQIDFDGQTYIVRSRQYYGSLVGNHVRQGGAALRAYYVFVFENITPIHRFVWLVNLMLLGILFLSGIVVGGSSLYPASVWNRILYN